MFKINCSTANSNFDLNFSIDLYRLTVSRNAKSFSTNLQILDKAKRSGINIIERKYVDNIFYITHWNKSRTCTHIIDNDIETSYTECDIELKNHNTYSDLLYNEFNTPFMELLQTTNSNISILSFFIINNILDNKLYNVKKIKKISIIDGMVKLQLNINKVVILPIKKEEYSDFDLDMII